MTTPLQILVRAWDRVESGTHATARVAIGYSAEVEQGAPIASAWRLLLESRGAAPGCSEVRLSETHLGYEQISDFGMKPDRRRELEVLERAIALAKTRST